MTQRYLQITYRNGLPLAAYLYLPRKVGDKVAKSVKCDGGLIVDYSADGRSIGIEITAPKIVTVESLNRALATANQSPVGPQEFQPLLSAAA